jgi:hypothetical protein
LAGPLEFTRRDTFIILAKPDNGLVYLQNVNVVITASRCCPVYLPGEMYGAQTGLWLLLAAEITEDDSSEKYFPFL